jgi:hypothetical protein
MLRHQFEFEATIEVLSKSMADSELNENEAHTSPLKVVDVTGPANGYFCDYSPPFLCSLNAAQRANRIRVNVLNDYRHNQVILHFPQFSG